MDLGGRTTTHPTVPGQGPAHPLPVDRLDGHHLLLKLGNILARHLLFLCQAALQGQSGLQTLHCTDDPPHYLDKRVVPGSSLLTTSNPLGGMSEAHSPPGISQPSQVPSGGPCLVYVHQVAF